ncbi:hypothetical protein M0804_007094 [Polistes exclamans]|nr:hypothetical protein M0804_007094 [Polistes exclamans]
MKLTAGRDEMKLAIKKLKPGVAGGRKRHAVTDDGGGSGSGRGKNKKAGLENSCRIGVIERRTKLPLEELESDFRWFQLELDQPVEREKKTKSAS